jgi:SAM-dependent methyltransferase
MSRSGSYDSTGGSEGEAERLLRQARSIWGREHAALRGFGLEPGQRLLDIGCGAGGTLRLLRESSPARLAVGVDLDRKFLAQARSFASVARADGATLPFGNDTFDFVLLRFVLRHTPAREALLAEATRVVRSGGVVCAFDADENALSLEPEPERWQDLRGALVTSARRRGGDPLIGRRLTVLLENAGLSALGALVLTVNTTEMAPATFIEVFLAPAARTIDPDLLTPAEAEAAWAQLGAWRSGPGAFGYTVGIMAAGRKR